MRCQVIGPRHFGTTRLRAIQDWIIRPRLLRVRGVIAVDSRTGPTRELRVEVDRALAQVDSAIHEMNHDGSLPPGVRIVPFYDRADLVRLATRTVMHSLACGCLLIFLAQWAFLGGLHRAIMAGLGIPCALLLAGILLIARGESAKMHRAALFCVLIILAALVPLFAVQSVEGAIFGPMARTYAYALGGALLATFTVTPVLASIFRPARVEESETLIVRDVHRAYDAALRFALAQRAAVIGSGIVFLAVAAFCWIRLGSGFLPRRLEGIVPWSLMLVLALLYGLFDPIKRSVLSLTGVPFAVAGGVLGLCLMRGGLGIRAAVGCISLLGVCALIGILLLNRCNRGRRPGLAAGVAGL